MAAVLMAAMLDLGQAGPALAQATHTVSVEYFEFGEGVPVTVTVTGVGNAASVSIAEGPLLNSGGARRGEVELSGPGVTGTHESLWTVPCTGGTCTATMTVTLAASVQSATGRLTATINGVPASGNANAPFVVHKPVTATLSGPDTVTEGEAAEYTVTLNRAQQASTAVT